MRLLDQKRRVEKALRAYRALLPAGAYFFIGEVRDGELKGIQEIVVRQEMTDRIGGENVVFGFFERGRAPQAGPERLHSEYPLVHHVQATSPEFMKKLQEYIMERVNQG